MRRLLLVAAALVAAALLTSCSEGFAGQTADEDPMELWEDGPHLRGANLHQRRVVEEIDSDFFGPGPFGPPVVQEDFDRLSASGANYVQLSVPGVFTEEAPYVLDPEAVANLDRLLRMAADADLYAVIAFRTGPGRSEFTFFPGEEDTWFPAGLVNNDVWTEDAAQRGWVEMWRYTADRYRGAGIVVGYELMVEPNGASTELGIDEPSRFTAEHSGSSYDWGALYPRIVAAVREADERTPLIVGAQGWSNPRWLPFLDRTDDERVVLTAHWYEPFAYTHQGREGARLEYPGDLDLDRDGEPEPFGVPALGGIMAPASETARARGRPLALTEYGVHRWAPGAPEYIRDVQLIFEDHGANSAIWGWSSLWPPTRELDAFDFFKGPAPEARTDAATALARAVREHWAKNERRPSDALEDPAAGIPDTPTGSPTGPGLP